ncbi:MAG TPA: nuclear transport factor 2 family protein [Solirubrobacteraceae bacterium]
MSQENVELARKLFEAHRAGGIDAVLPFYPSDVRMSPGRNWVEEPVYHGHEGVRTLNGLFAENFDDWGWVVHEIRDAGDQVVALVEMTGRIKGSGVPVSTRQGIVASDFRAGTVADLRFFDSWEEALEAVGLEE